MTVTLTIDQGGYIVKVMTAFGIPVVLCSAHRLNSFVSWMLGISVSSNTLIQRLVAYVGKFSYSTLNKSELEAAQALMEEFSQVYELVRRTDTR